MNTNYRDNGLDSKETTSVDTDLIQNFYRFIHLNSVKPISIHSAMDIYIYIYITGFICASMKALSAQVVSDQCPWGRAFRHTSVRLPH